MSEVRGSFRQDFHARERAKYKDTDSDARRLSRVALLDDYAAIAKRRPMALEATAIRLGSWDLVELMAYVATEEHLSIAEIRDRLEGDSSGSFVDSEWIGRLGRALALLPPGTQDVETAAHLLECADRILPDERVNLRFRRLLFELYLERRQFEAARDLLERQPSLRGIDQGYLETDLLNPFIATPFSDKSRWMQGISRHFTANRLERIDVRIQNDGSPFDGIVCEASIGSSSGPLVSVIMTAFNPEPLAVEHAVRSILSQTYADLELLIVDDASSPDSAEHLRALAARDERARYFRVAENGGTYRARNLGLAHANGVFVTGQDADDWSHPRRIEREVAALDGHSDRVGVRASALFVSENLVGTRVGYRPRALHAPSLMARTADVRRLGGYLDARRAADNELHRRLEAASGLPVIDLNVPLSIYRVLPDSLSRGDFRAGWRHPARSAFSDAYSLWHSDSAGDWERLSRFKIPIPGRFEVERRRREYDVVLAGDWRQNGGPQKSMLEEIAALTRAGFRVGILHLEAARFMSQKAGSLCQPVQRLINDRVVDRVLYDDSSRVRLLVLRYPPILQFVPVEASSLEIESVVILANQAPSERDGSDVRYRVSDCSLNAERIFQRKPLWVPQGPTVRDILEEDVESSMLAPFDLPGILDLDEWRTPRGSFRGSVPVIGRHSRDNVMKWPAEAEALLDVYPEGEMYDVRVMGGASVPARTLGREQPPREWLVFDVDEMPVRDFLSSLDFFVYFQNRSAYDAFGRAILEAAAAGAIPIIEPHFERTFGSAAVYSEPEDALRVVQDLRSDRRRYEAILESVWTHVSERFSYESYVKTIKNLLAEIPIRSV